MQRKYKLLLMLAVFIAAYFLPLGGNLFQKSLLEALLMLQEYARDHVLLCLVPAFFIAGGISLFVSQASVLKYFGVNANRILSYGVASISGTILAVCSCTVLPLFAGIYTRGAGIGPATAFLYSGPAINVLAIILTARVLGMEIGIARAAGAVVFSVIIGLSMSLFFGKEDRERIKKEGFAEIEIEKPKRSLVQEVIFFASMIIFLVFANFAPQKTMNIKDLSGNTFQALLINQDKEVYEIKHITQDINLKTSAVDKIERISRSQIIDIQPVEGIYTSIWKLRWYIAIASILMLAMVLYKWFSRSELRDWIDVTMDFAIQIFPLLFGGVLVAGFLLGRPGHEAMISSKWISSLVGGNSVLSNFLASILGAFMYFATLTEIPILQGLMGAGMGKGPALSLLLSGPALSLPSMLVINSIMGFRKTFVYIILVVVFSTISGLIFGFFFP